MAVPELSLDLLVLIAKEVDDRATLLSLCRTCKGLNAVATPLLFTDLRLHLGSGNRHKRPRWQSWEPEHSTKQDSIPLVHRVLGGGYAQQILSLNVEGDELIEDEDRPKKLARMTTMEVKEKLSITSLLDNPVSAQPAKSEPVPAKVEPLLELVQQSTKLQSVEWKSLSVSLETLRSLTSLQSLQTVRITFYMSDNEAELLDDHIKAFPFNNFSNLTALELYKLAGNPRELRTGVINIFFNNPGLRKLGLSAVTDWFRRHDEHLDRWDDSRGMYMNWFMHVVNDIASRMKRAGKTVLLRNLEELYLLEGFMLSEDGPMNLQEVIDISKLKAFHYNNTAQAFEEADIPPENYDCFKENAVDLEEISVDEFSDNIVELINVLPNFKRLRISDAPDSYHQDKLKPMMDRGVTVECPSWDVNLWYKNQTERGGDPYAGFW